MKVVRRPRFLDDLTESYSYISDQSPSAADRLLDAVEGIVDLLIEFPQLGRSHPELGPGIRSFRLRVFPHVIFYRLTSDEIVLLRILHGARRIGVANPHE